MKMLTRRSSAAVRSDWSLVPTVRSSTFKWQSEHIFAIAAPFAARRDGAAKTQAKDLIDAMKNLYKHLHSGCVGSGVNRIPIKGDTTLLPRANGLTALERRIAHAYNFLAREMSGTQQLRRLMGHTQFGARVVYGDCLFMTISPNPQMSALTLRLSRYRDNDPYIQYSDAQTQQLAKDNAPKLEAKRRRLVSMRPSCADTNDFAEIDIPIYDERLKMTARDPLAIIEGYRIEVILRLAALLGVRMCPNCPRCNHSLYGCQDLFGSNMRPLGGVLGGMTSLGGATEHQGHGTPHLHFEGHVVCIYQYGTLEEIAAKIRTQGLGHLRPQSLHAYNDWLHHTKLLDEPLYSEFRDKVEAAFDTRFADTSHDPLCVTPTFIYEDAQSDGAQAMEGDEPVWATDVESIIAGHEYKREYSRHAQFVFSRVQHHVHQHTKKGYVPLNNCARKHGKRRANTTCKADFPMTNLCIDKNTVVCRGIAKKLKLKVSGRRNSLGKIIGQRMCEWQSGTTPAFAVLFGSNTHTAPNYRVPIMPETHDDERCKSAACKAWMEEPGSTKKIAKLAQRAQREATGYYTGYINKGQPVGTKYLKTMAQTLDGLHEGLEKKTVDQQWHRITHRAMQDFQGRSMVRTAPEEWNLASRWHDQDPKTAEFVRTYRSDFFPGIQLVLRLDMEEKKMEDRDIRKVVPRMHGRSSGPDDMLRNWVDFYGYRGRHPAVFYLSPWEFLILWEILPLPKPSLGSASKATAISRWVPKPRKKRSTEDEPDEYEPNPALAIASDDADAAIVFFGRIPGEVQLRNRWYMRRRLRPMVPAPGDMPMPDKQKDRDKKSRLFALYLRPWVLDSAMASQSASIPHLGDLDLVHTAQERSYALAWSRYVRGHIVSHHARRHIIQFMAACCGKSTQREPVELDIARQLQEIPNNTVPLDRVHKLLSGLAQTEQKYEETPSVAKVASEEGDEESENDAEQAHRKALGRSHQIQSALMVTDALFKSSNSQWGTVPAGGEMHNFGAKASTVAGAAKKKKIDVKECKKQALATQCRAYSTHCKSDIRQWIADLKKSDDRPSPEQEHFLKHVIARCDIEQSELKVSGGRAPQNNKFTEPVRACLFGIPGAGKSHCIKLVRRFFEECLKWQDGLQFQFMAQQNTMAALIGGKTVNTWGAIPINPDAASRKQTARKQDGDVDDLFLNALGIRWLIIDECSTISPQLLAQLNAALRRACLRHPYARDGTRHRPFGGINIIFAGDLWQLPPVRANAIFSNPYTRGTYSYGEKHILEMFWQHQEDSIQTSFELTESKRTTDKWLQAVLAADRRGAETWEMYCFQHGLPTRNPGSYCPFEDKVTCKNCEALQAEWRDPKSVANQVRWAIRVQTECQTCKKERARRCIVISQSVDNQRRVQETPFTEAPYVSPFRYPSNHAQHLRAIQFAKAHSKRLYWITAYDAVQHDAADFKGERGEKKKEQWLQLPEKQTSGIPGLFPAIRDLPVRFTETPDGDAREKGVFKGARGWLRGWELEEEEQKRLERCSDQDGEVVLERRPKRLFIEMQNPHKALPKIGDKQIYILRVVPKEWSLGKDGKIKIQRYGFTIVPDFGGTAHFYCGSSLDACIGDLLAWPNKPRRDAALRAYIIKSRVKDCSQLLLPQPYSPQLFRQGVMPGPHLLHETLMKRKTPEEAKLAWKKHDREEEEAAKAAKKASDKQQVSQLSTVQACCRGCSDEASPPGVGEMHRVEVWKPLSAFLPHTFENKSGASANDVWKSTIAKGQELRCWKCAQWHATDTRTKECILCCECDNIKPVHKFSCDMQEAWLQRRDYETIICSDCRKEAYSYKNARPYKCGKCGEEKPEYQFLEQDLVATMADQQAPTDQLCLQCKVTQMKDIDDTCKYECQRCHGPKGVKELSPSDIKDWLQGRRHHDRYVCYECRFPQCKLCTKRPKHAVSHNAWADNEYMCILCKYPPCKVPCCIHIKYGPAQSIMYLLTPFHLDHNRNAQAQGVHIQHERGHVSGYEVLPKRQRTLLSLRRRWS